MIFFIIIAVSLTSFICGISIGRIFFPAKPFLDDDIKDSLMMLSRTHRENVMRWLKKEVLP